MFCKKDVIRNFAKFIGNRLCQCLYFNKVAGFIKIETLAQVFSCEFCEISKNTFSYRTPPVAASVLMKKCLLNFAWHHVILKKDENLLKSNKPVSVRIQQKKHYNKAGNSSKLKRIFAGNTFASSCSQCSTEQVF